MANLGYTLSDQTVGNILIHLESRRVEVAGITPHPNERWMKQIAQNVTMGDWGFN